MACRSHELRPGRPLLRHVFGAPIVLFRAASGQVGAFVDRCPHRNVPLSCGRVEGDTLRCAYHGWQFDTDGRCRHVPGLAGEPSNALSATRHAVRERQGFVWVWATPGEEPTTEPHHFARADDPAYLVVLREVRATASLHAVAENALDVPHTAFLHGGWFRTDRDRKPITCVVRRSDDRVECEYVGEARPGGLLGRLLSPSGGTVVHFDRFLLPSIVQVEYRLGDENHVLVEAALTPVDDFDTRLFAVVAVRTRVPRWLVRPIATPVALRIFRQDAAILARQTDTVRRFGEQRFVSTEIDLLGPHILKLLQRAAVGRAPIPDRPPTEREVTLLV